MAAAPSATPDRAGRRPAQATAATTKNVASPSTWPFCTPSSTAVGLQAKAATHRGSRPRRTSTCHSSTLVATSATSATTCQPRSRSWEAPARWPARNQAWASGG